MPRLSQDERERRLTFGRRALGIAYNRLSALEKPGDPDLTAVAAAAAECLAWICALDDMKPLGRKSRPMQALRWARNAALHEIVVWAEPATESMLTLDVSVSARSDRFPHSQWADRAALGSVRRSTPEGEAAYDAELAGRPVMDAIRTVRAVLDPEFAERLARYSATLDVSPTRHVER